MISSVKRYCIAAMLSLLCVSQVMAINDPVRMLQSVTDQVLTELKENKAVLEAQPEKVNEIVDRLMVPHADFVEMSRWVAGRAAWSRASDSEKHAFIKAFRDLIVHTYAGSLNEYDAQSIEYKPLRGNPSATQVQVASVINTSDSGPIHLSYRLTRASGEWKVYDIVIEGVSLLKGFQNQFSQEISEDGLAAVTEKIRNHNEK